MFDDNPTSIQASKEKTIKDQGHSKKERAETYT